MLLFRVFTQPKKHSHTSIITHRHEQGCDGKRQVAAATTMRFHGQKMHQVRCCSEIREAT